MTTNTTITGSFTVTHHIENSEGLLWPDQRYVDHDDDRAVLRAWAGPDLTLPMGGWMDDDRDAFEAAVRRELSSAFGEQEADGVRVSIEFIASGGR